MLAFVFVETGWSIAWLDDGSLEWWCGDVHEWVAQGSSYWETDPDCWNWTFPTLGEARQFARKRGWLRHDR